MRKAKETNKAALLITDISNLLIEKKEIREVVKEKEAEVRKEEIITVVVMAGINIEITHLKRERMSLIKRHLLLHSN